jgi:uncharacterized protein YqjF (DUF2071 family)
MKRTFLEAEWRKLIMANYVVDPEVLAAYLPHKTELDYWNGNCYVSLVAFMFLNTKLKGMRIPFHVNFGEINLRFYVRRRELGVWKRGVVFVKEIVPRPALSWVANTLYKEKYVTMPVNHLWQYNDNLLDIKYSWGRGLNHWLGVTAQRQPEALSEGTEAAFIADHYWGYSKVSAGKTAEYEVQHPRWKVYPVQTYSINVDFGQLYGPGFAFLKESAPVSVLLAEGSAIQVKNKITL